MKKMICLVAVLCIVGSVSAYDGWIAGGGVSDWGLGSNWSRSFAPAHLGESTGWSAPTPTSDVDITIDQAPVFGGLVGERDYATLGGPFYARTMMRGDIDYNIDIRIPATSIGIEIRDEWWMRAGVFEKNTTLHMDGSSLTLSPTATLRVGGGGAAATALINLDGGVIDVQGTLDLRSNGIIDITAGTLIVAGSYAPNANIIGYGGAGTVSYVEGGGVTTITAVPEPVTMMLLGLGGLSLIRRKR